MSHLKKKIHPYFEIRHKKDGKIVRHSRRGRFTPKETHVVLIPAAGWGGPTPRLLNADREGIGHLKNFSKGPTGNRTRNLPFCGAVPQVTAPTGDPT
jgi:hypothetical protein